MKFWFWEHREIFDLPMKYSAQLVKLFAYGVGDKLFFSTVDVTAGEILEHSVVVEVPGRDITVA